MEIKDDELCTDEEDQRVRSTKKVKMQENELDDGVYGNRDDIQNCLIDSDIHGEEGIKVSSHTNRIKSLVSYKSMLLGVNGVDNNSSSEEEDKWSDNTDSEDNMEDQENEEMDPLCPSITISTEERENLCKP